MAALLVSFSISTRHCPVDWVRMRGNVQLWSVVLVCFFFMSCPDRWQLRTLEWNTECVFVCFGVFFFHVHRRRTEPRRGNNQTKWTVKNLDFRYIKKNVLVMCLPGAQTNPGTSNVNVSSGKVGCFFFCCLWGYGSVLCHLNEWLSILLCLCVLRLFVFALWIFWEEKKKNHLHIWCFSVCLCTTLHTVTLGGKTLITKSVY